MAGKQAILLALLGGCALAGSHSLPVAVIKTNSGFGGCVEANLAQNSVLLSRCKPDSDLQQWHRTECHQVKLYQHDLCIAGARACPFSTAAFPPDSTYHVLDIEGELVLASCARCNQSDGQSFEPLRNSAGACLNTLRYLAPNLTIQNLTWLSTNDRLEDNSC